MSGGVVFVILLILALVIACADVNKRRKNVKHGEDIGLELLRRHPEVLPCKTNADMFTACFTQAGLPLTIENAEKIYEDIKEHMVHKTSQSPASVRTKESARLLPDTRTPSGGIIIWVHDIAPLQDALGNIPLEELNRSWGAFDVVDGLMWTLKEDWPSYWKIAMASASLQPEHTMGFEVHPATDGGYEIWIDLSNIKKSPPGSRTDFQIV
jgi:hypothetical protein